MAIDYSKWDKIELSDDSDIEVHPNVDKRSFIRWKQQSIHEEREKRKGDIKNLEFQMEMYSHLNKRVDKLLREVTDEDLVHKDSIVRFLNSNFDKTEKGSGSNVDPDLPPYNEMVEDLFEQMERNAQNDGKDPKNGRHIREELMKHRAKIESVTEEAKTKLQELYEEKTKHISSEDFHTGFDKGFVNKGGEQEGKPSFIPETKPNEVRLPLPMVQPIEYLDDVLKLATETEEFGNIASGNYQVLEKFLLNHLQILSEQQKDALMMSAFEYEMEGNTSKAYQVIHQSELMSYILEIYAMKKLPGFNVNEMKEVVTMFFNRLFSPHSNPMAKKSFLESVNTKYEHVKQRSKVMQAETENEAEGVETIQLKALDDSTELNVTLPDFSSDAPEEKIRIDIFKQLPPKMQGALKSESLEEINSVFAEMPIEEAEKVLDVFQEGGFIGINALLEDESEFQELQEHYKNEQHMENLSIEDNQHVDANLSTSDVVD